MYLHMHMHYIPLTHTHTIICNFNQHKHTHIQTHTHSHILTITHRDSYKIPTVFDCIFRFSNHFILLTTWLLLFCKNSMTPRGCRLNSMALYIYLLLLYNSSILDMEHSPYYIALGSPQIPHSDLVTTKTVMIYIYLYIYIKCIWFGLVGFYSISTFVYHLMPYPFYTY